MNNIDFKDITGFIIDDNDIVINKESSSPLIGMYSAFKELNSLDYEKALVLACDTPLIKYEVLDLLIKECKTFECCIPKWKDNLLEPLLAIYPIKKAYDTSQRNIRNNQYKLTKIISAEWKTNFISIEDDIKTLDSDLVSFKNINLIEEIEILETNLNKQQ